MRKTLTSIALVFAALLIPSLCFADCDDISKDPEFQKGFKNLVKLYESGKYPETIEAAKPLFAKCKESPAVLYYTGLAFREQGNIDSAKLYIQKSSEALSKYSADPGISRKIWYTRHELEFPESNAEAIKAKNEKINNLTNEVNEVKHQIEAYVQKNHDLELTVVSSGDVSRYKKMMWTGIGLGIGGAAMAASGGVLWGIDKEISISNIKYNNGDLKGKSKFGMTNGGQLLLGIGVGMAIVGTVMAGINGYYYSHLSKKEEDTSHISMNVGLGSLGFEMAFY